MNKSRRKVLNIDLLSSIQEFIKVILSYRKNMNAQRFLKDCKTQDAIIYNFQMIAEIFKNLSKGLKRKYRDIAWEDWAIFGDNLIHRYYDIYQHLIWNMVKELPSLVVKIDRVVGQENKFSS